MKRILLLSDTHSFIDPLWPQYMESCDEIWHAGDIGNEEVLDYLESLNKPVRAVWGNIDDHKVRRRLPEILSFEVEGLKVLMLHIGGYPDHYAASARLQIAQHSPGLFICGHSHILRVMNDKKYGMLVMNPGAAGINGFHLVRTLLRFSIDSGKVKDAEVIEVGPRGKLSSGTPPPTRDMKD